MVSESQEDEPDVETLLAELVNRPAWHSQANCRGADPDLFFPPRGARRVTQRAMAICEDCPVRAECLASALEVWWIQGVWGGLSATERKVLRKRGA